MEELKSILIEFAPFLIALVGVGLIALMRVWFKGRSSGMEKVIAEQVLNLLIDRAVEYAENKAEERREDEEVASDQDKIYMAIDKIKELMKEHGILEIAEDEIEKRIEAAFDKKSEGE